MPLIQRALTDADLDQAWEIEREAFNVDASHRDEWVRWERAVGLDRVEGVFIDGRLVAMAGVVEGFRWALLGTNTAPGPMTIVSAIVALALFVSGAFYFRRLEQSFADIL